MNTENQTPNKYKRYDEAFKRSAVELWLQGGKSIELIARERASAPKASSSGKSNWRRCPPLVWVSVRFRNSKRRTGGYAVKCAIWRSSGTF